jgi:hypothetical protein
MEGGRTNPNATKKRRGEEVEGEVEPPEGVAVADWEKVEVGSEALKLAVGEAIVSCNSVTRRCSLRGARCGMGGRGNL